MTVEPGAQGKRMRLRYRGTCRLCGTALPAGSDAVYERERRTVRCLACHGDSPSAPTEVAAVPGPSPAPEPDAAPSAVDPGVAGSSARREHERRSRQREDRIRAAHPKLGGLILALSDDPQSTRAWERGAIGEEMLSERLAGLPPAARLLHDRRIPRTRANIDHIVVSPAGVWVLDAKRYKGRRPTREVTDGLFGPRVESLRIGGRSGAALVTAVQKQVALVQAALDDPAVPLCGVLCFVEADWPLFGGSFSVSGIEVTWPNRLVRLIAQEPDRGVDALAVQARLAAAFPPA